MKPITKGAWRSVRCFLLVACAGGVLAADDTWVSTLNVDFVNPRHWFSSEVSTDAAEISAAIAVHVDTAQGAQLSMGGLINGLLFARPAGRWALDPSAVETRSSLGRRLVEFDQINPVSNGDSFITFHAPASSSSFAAVTGPVSTEGSAGPASPTAITASGNWISNASGNWGNAANWQGGVVADGAGNSAHFDLLNITTDVTVTLDTSRTIDEVYLGDTNGTHRYTIAPVGGTSLTFDSGAPFTRSLLQQSSSSGGDTVAANIFVNNDLDINNFSSSNPFQITGNIASSAPGDAFQNLWFNSANGAAGEIRATGNISDGTGSARLSVVVVDGTVIFSGNNTYTGSTSVDGGTLLINGNNSGANGSVFVGAGGTLGGTGTVGGDVFTFDGTVTGGTATTVGALTLTGNVNLATGEGDGTYLANLSGTLSDLLAIGGNLQLGAGSILDIDGVGDGITTYTIATFASRDDVFGSVLDLPSGYNLVYHDMDIQLVPIPEPATWIGGALVFAALVFTQRRRLGRPLL
jgi:autotransporter-associated beta strand protein